MQSSDSLSPQTKRRFHLGTAALPYLLILPTLLFVVVFTVYPMLRVAYDSLFLANQAVQTPQFFALGNYVALLNDSAFRNVIANTFLYALVTVPVSVFFALILAILLNRKIQARGLFRLAFFYPTVLPMVSAATVWLFMYTPDYGLVNIFLQVFHIPSLNWLGEASLALPALMILGIWKQTGYFMIFYLAGLQGVPSELYDAAQVDGAGWLATLRNVTLPMISPVIFYDLTLAMIGLFQYFLVPLVLNSGTGAPGNATMFFNLNLYKTFFAYGNMGYGAAMAWLLFVVILIATVALFKSQKYWVFYAGETK